MTNNVVARNPYHVKEDMYTQERGVFVPEPKLKGAMIGALTKYTGSDDNRHLVLHWLFGVTSSKQLDDWMWAGIYTWIGWHKDENGEWQVSDTFKIELALVLTIAIRDYYKTKDHPIERDKESLVDTLVVDLDGYISTVNDGIVIDYVNAFQVHVAGGLPSTYIDYSGWLDRRKPDKSVNF